MSASVTAMAAPQDEERAAQVQRVRAMLIHPKDATGEDEEGRVRWVKPPLALLENLEMVLSKDPYFTERIAYNEFSDTVEWCGECLTDEMITEVGLSIRRTYKLRLSSPSVHEVVVYIAKKLAYHPVRDYLNGLQWDGERRIDRLLADYVGAEDDDLNRELSRRFLISAVARVMDPGCKVDTTLILVGAQGSRKSTFFRLLCGAEWFSDSALDMRNKDAYISLGGTWFYELAELAAMQPRDAETVKAFLSAPVDRYRPPYGRNLKRSPRQCVFVGTTNEAAFLNDLTGARRFWPAKVGDIRLGDLQRDRDQLWAEAVEAYKGNERWWLELNADAELRDRHQAFEHDDPWAGLVEKWLAGNGVVSRTSGVTVATILEAAIEMDADRMRKGDEMRVAAILGALGWTKKRARMGGDRTMRWFPG